MDEQTRKLVTDVVDGDSLDAALRDYGPAAIDDLLPRLRTIAEALDAAHATGQVHGSLHPQNIFVSAESTHVTWLEAGVETSIRLPYSAPEIVSGSPALAASDQFALAAITFEWLFGRRITGPAVRPVEVRALPGVDRDAMARAFTRALAPEPATRYSSCTAFSNAIAGAVIPVLPLGDVADDNVLDTEFLPEAVVDTPVESLAVEPPSLVLDADLAIDEAPLDMFEPALAPEAIDQPEGLSPRFREGLLPPIEPVTSWQPSASYTPTKTAERFSGGMLIVSCLVGMVVGFAAGYMAKPRALQSAPIAQGLASEAGRALGASEAGGAGRVGTEGTLPSAQPAQPAPPAQPASQEVPASGRLLIRSTPSGASVDVDGVARGLTPLALRDLALGSRAISVTRRGYLTEERRVVLTSGRPSRSLEIRLLPPPSAAEGRSGETAPKPAGSRAGVGGAAAAAATGGLLIESRPAGASVVIDGKPRGTTPLTVAAMAPGNYRINLSLAGYQPFATTVRVVAGERTRAAASLSVQE